MSSYHTIYFCTQILRCLLIPSSTVSAVTSRTSLSRHLCCEMSTEALASWLKIRRCQAAVKSLLDTGTRPCLGADIPWNRTLHSNRSREHHRIFWREETTSSSVCAGAHKAIETAGGKAQTQSPPTNDNAAASVSDKSGDRDGEVDQTHPAVYVLKKVSKRSDLKRLDRLLETGKIDPACLSTFTAAIKDGNPSIVEALLAYGKDSVGSFYDTFRGWGREDVRASQQLGFPLHTACHLGSPYVVSLLVSFIRGAYSDVEAVELMNARDHYGRTALHVASWSPRGRCPGKRHATIRTLLANGASVDATDAKGKTPLHEACRAGDRFAVEILLGSGANPFEEDHRMRTPAEAVCKKSRGALGKVFRRQLSHEKFLQLVARSTAKQVVYRVLQRAKGPLCDTCQVRAAQKCDAQRQQNFAAWLYTHERWPKAGRGEWGDVRPSCVEHKETQGKK